MYYRLSVDELKEIKLNASRVFISLEMKQRIADIGRGHAAARLRRRLLPEELPLLPDPHRLPVGAAGREDLCSAQTH